MTKDGWTVWNHIDWRFNLLLFVDNNNKNCHLKWMIVERDAVLVVDLFIKVVEIFFFFVLVIYFLFSFMYKYKYNK